MPNNKHTTKLLDVIWDEDMKYVFLVMDYFPVNLYSLLESRNTFHIEEIHVKKLTYNLLCSINYLHSANIMHRDMKPANILVDEHFNVRLCDFGFARCNIDSDQFQTDSE